MNDGPNPADSPRPDDWIVIPNWDKFQHYRDRRPTWIKVYTEVVSRDEMLDLTDAEFGLLVRIWALYADRDGRITSRTLPEHGRNRGRTRALKRLNEAGLIRFSASRPLAPELREREETPYPLTEKAVDNGGGRDLLTEATAYAETWTGTSSVDFDDHLDALERELHARLTHTQRSRLWDTALERGRR